MAIARALVGDPAIVLADEPTGNLDSQTSDAIVDLLVELHGRGRTIVLITHDKEIAARAPARVAILDGRITTDSAPAGGGMNATALEPPAARPTSCGSARSGCAPGGPAPP